MSRRTLDPAVPLYLSLTGLSPSLAGFPNTILLGSASSLRSETPERTRSGLASFAFARRYLRNRSFFLFLALLRCFSSGGSPPHAMDSRTDAWSLSMRVSPFRHPRIIGYLHLPAAFRSLSRLSSALSAKASSLRSLQLNLFSSFCLQHTVYSGIDSRMHAAQLFARSPTGLYSVTFQSRLSYKLLCFPSRRLRGNMASDVSFPISSQRIFIPRFSIDT